MTASITGIRGLLPLLLGFGIVGATAGCDLVGTRGQGAVKTEARDVADFSRIETSAGIAVAVRIGPTRSLEVRAQENILPIIVTEVQNDTLRLRSTHGFTTTEKVEVVLTTPALTKIILSGGAHGQVDDLKTDSLDIELSGGSRLEAAGEAADVSLHMSGGSVAELAGLVTRTINFDGSGGCRATVNASDRIHGSASGGTRATVLGGAKLEVDLTGDSAVERG